MAAQTLTDLSPSQQRVHDYVVLEGSGFGTSQGAGEVVFTDGAEEWPAGRAYVWRDNYIRIRVPVGKLVAGTPTPIDRGPLSVFVRLSGGAVSGALPFRVVTVPGGASATFRQLTSLGTDHADNSTTLGSPPLNAARTKDAEIADVNGDGWPDINDNNSNNVQNGTHSVLRLNGQDKSFTAIRFEPLASGEAGTFATEVPSGGDFFGDHTSYDSDYADIDGDRLPDLLQTAADNFGGPGSHRVRILVNNRGGTPGRFTEETAARLPGSAFGSVGCPDDIDHVDMDDDGDVDFLVTMRTAPGFCPGTTSEIRVFENDGSGTFAAPTVITSRTGISTHDAFWFDANADGIYDVVAANEFDMDGGDGIDVRVQLFLNDGAGNFTENRTFDLAATAGDAADFNGDGLMDFVVGRTEVRVLLTDPASPCLTNPASQCTYQEVVLLPSMGNNPFYDLEPGDVNADGAVDIVGARILDTADNVLIWINQGDGTFTEVTGGNASSVLPDHDGTYQRLSADLIDFDLDGDLDLYVTGQDTDDEVPGGGTGLGRGPNQFYENLLIGIDIVNPRQSAPAYAGSSTGGRKVLVRMRANLAVSDLTPGDFAVDVDGSAVPDGIVTGAAIEEEYWLLVQMPAKPDGCYDLTVSLVADPGLTDTEPLSLCYDADRFFDRVLSIDRTHSMLNPTVEKMAAARAAGRFFIDLAEDEDEIGVVSFQRDTDDGDGVVEQDELAGVDFPLEPAFDAGASDDRRDDAKIVVDGVGPAGPGFPQETSIGAGLREAWDELIASGDGGHEWEIVLLSDGLENFAPFWSEAEPGPPIVLPLKPDVVGADPPIRVHTVAVGEDAAVEVLMDIAESTGGTFYNLYEGTASFGLMSRLAAVYKYIDEEIRDEQRFFYREGLPAPIGVGGVGPDVRTELADRKLVRLDSLYVPPDFESVTIGFHWDVAGGIGSLTLLDPAATPVVEAPPLRRVESDARHRVYRISDPDPGWHYYVVEGQVAEPIEFFATASGISDLVAKPRRGAVGEVSPGVHDVTLRVIVGDFAPVLFAHVTGEVILPDKTRVPIELFDDGTHEDGADRDGIYGRTFSHAQPGGYTAEIVTTGVSNRNEPFTRHSTVSWAFPGADPDPDEPDPRDRPDPSGDDPFGRGTAFSFHVGSAHPLGTLNEGHDANVHLRLDASRRLTDRVRALLILGFSQFTADLSSGLDNRWWSHVSANAQVTLATPGPLDVLAAAGPGVYWPKSGSASAGFNLGLSGRFEIGTAPFALEFGGDYHLVSGGLGDEEDAQFLTAQLGVAWRF